MRNVGLLLLVGLWSLISIPLFSSCDKKNDGPTIEYTVALNDSSVYTEDVVSLIDKRLREYGNKKHSIEILEADSDSPERIKITVSNVKNPSLMRKLLTTRGQIQFYETLRTRYGDYISRLVSCVNDSDLPIFERAYNVDDTWGVVEHAMPEAYRNPLISFFKIEDVDSVCNVINDLHAKGLLDADVKLVKGFPVNVDNQTLVPLYAVKENAVMDGSYIAKSKAVVDDIMGNMVEFQLIYEGCKLFERITANNIGNPISIVIDEQLICSPIVNDVIEGGKCQITGNFSPEDVELYNMLLSAGALPTGLTLISEQLVMPQANMPREAY